MNKEERRERHLQRRAIQRARAKREAEYLDYWSRFMTGALRSVRDELPPPPMRHSESVLVVYTPSFHTPFALRLSWGADDASWQFRCWWMMEDANLWYRAPKGPESARNPADYWGNKRPYLENRQGILSFTDLEPVCYDLTAWRRHPAYFETPPGTATIVDGDRFRVTDSSASAEATWEWAHRLPDAWRPLEVLTERLLAMVAVQPYYRLGK